MFMIYRRLEGTHRGVGSGLGKEEKLKEEEGPGRSDLVLLTLDPVNSWVSVVGQDSLKPLILLSLVETQPLNSAIVCECSVPGLGVADGKFSVSCL